MLLETLCGFGARQVGSQAQNREVVAVLLLVEGSGRVGVGDVDSDSRGE